MISNIHSKIKFDQVINSDVIYLHLFKKSEVFHLKETTPSVLFIGNSLGDLYYIPFDHHDERIDSNWFSWDLFSNFKIITSSYKELVNLIPNCNTILNYEWISFHQTNEHNDISNFCSKFLRRRWNFDLIRGFNNWMTPIHKLAEPVQKMIQSIDFVWNESLLNSQLLYRSLAKIETNGIRVDESFKSDFSWKGPINNGIIYCDFRMGDKMLRPSNSKWGLNFAALNKNDESRSHFISRFDNGKLIEIDFDSYHLQLLYTLMGLSLPSESIHEYLGKRYFGKSELTESEREKSKEITFPKIYSGNITHEDLEIPLFQGLKMLSDDLYQNWLSNNFLELKTGFNLYRIKNVSPSKLLNYYIQSYESYMNGVILDKILNYIYNNQLENTIIPIMYTYDSILFDVNDSSSFDNIIELCKPYKIHLKSGKNYKELS